MLQALVEKDWLAFGHPFSDRVGMPTLSGSGNMPFEVSRQSSSSGSFSSSPMRQSSGSLTSQAPATTSSHSQNSNNYSPIFLQVGLFRGIHLGVIMTLDLYYFFLSSVRNIGYLDVNWKEICYT